MVYCHELETKPEKDRDTKREFPFSLPMYEFDTKVVRAAFPYPGNFTKIPTERHDYAVTRHDDVSARLQS